MRYTESLYVARRCKVMWKAQIRIQEVNKCPITKIYSAIEKYLQLSFILKKNMSTVADVLIIVFDERRTCE